MCFTGIFLFYSSLTLHSLRTVPHFFVSSCYLYTSDFYILSTDPYFQLPSGLFNFGGPTGILNIKFPPYVLPSCIPYLTYWFSFSLFSKARSLGILLDFSSPIFFRIFNTSLKQILFMLTLYLLLNCVLFSPSSFLPLFNLHQPLLLFSLASSFSALALRCFLLHNVDKNFILKYHLLSTSSSLPVPSYTIIRLYNFLRTCFLFYFSILSTWS